MSEPQLVRYFDATFGRNTHEYLVKERDGKVFLCSIMTYQLAKMLNRTHEMEDISTSSLPIEWCNYMAVYEETSEQHFFPSVLQENLKEILDLANENFHYISRITSFFENFSDYASQKDFLRCCRIAWILNEKHMPEQLMQKVFDIVFRFFPEQVEENKFNLLLLDGISPYFTEFKH